MWQRIRTDPRH